MRRLWICTHKLIVSPISKKEIISGILIILVRFKIRMVSQLIDSFILFLIVMENSISICRLQPNVKTLQQLALSFLFLINLLWKTNQLIEKILIQKSNLTLKLLAKLSQEKIYLNTVWCFVNLKTNVLLALKWSNGQPKLDY